MAGQKHLKFKHAYIDIERAQFKTQLLHRTTSSALVLNRGT